MNALLDQITWLSLNRAHAHFSSGTSTARRYARGFSPILGFADPLQPDFAALTPFCDASEEFYTDGWAGKVPAGWALRAESTMHKMVWRGSIPPLDETLAAVPLQKAHALQALQLAQLTRPGPFGPRTLELGDYYGCLVGEQLVAMAGERMCAAPLREISGVCTHPDFQGRGFARKLMLQLVYQQMQRGEIPFLHVMHDNHSAHQLYLRMGFVDYRESVVRVVARESG